MHDCYNPFVGDHYIGGPYAKHACVLDDFVPVESMDYLTTELTDQFLRFVKNHNQSKPFFAYLAYNAPHTPIQAPERLVHKYLSAGHDAVFATRMVMVDMLDSEIGRVLDNLQENGLLENTLVVFMSDNGPENVKLTGGLRGTKMTAWEGGVRVPMIAAFPKEIQGGQINSSMCSIVDLAATFIGLSKGVNDFKYGDGYSLMPYFKGVKTGPIHYSQVFSIHLLGAPYATPSAKNIKLLGVRSGDWKLVVDKDRKIDVLYNLKADLYEKKDLSASHTDLKDKLYLLGDEYLHHSKPDSAKIHSIDTRENGSQEIRNSLINKYPRKNFKIK